MQNRIKKIASYIKQIFVREAKGRPIQTTIKADKKIKDGTVFQKGSKVKVEFVKMNRGLDAISVAVEGSDRKPAIMSIQNAHTWLNGFSKPPSTKVLEQWISNNVAKSVTGKKVEPDGYGIDGSPSWLLVMGMI